MTTKVIGRAAVLIAMLAVIMPGRASASQAPDALVKQTANEVIKALEDNDRKLEQNPDEVFALVDRIVLPHFDFERMSQLVLGQQWRKASQAQREAFVEEFRRLLVNTYATALLDYEGQELRFKPYRESGGGEAKVRTEVVPDQGPPIPIDYALHRTEGGDWKVYDISVDGISLVTNYRASYQRMAKSDGLDALIDKIAARNSSKASD